MANERKFVVENIRRVLLKEYLMKETERAGFGGLDIQRTPIGTRISLFIERPGLVIGRQGGAIKSLTETLEKEFKFDNPQIEVQEVENPSLNAQIMAEKLAVALERGWHFRRAGHSTVRRIMDAGARGCQVVLSGKLTGQRHRTEKFKEGHIKHCGEPSKKFMKDGFAVAKLKLGIIGVKVQIMDADSRLPDDIEIEAALAVEGEGEDVAAVGVAETAAEGEALKEEVTTEAEPVEEVKIEEPVVETPEVPTEEPKVEAKPETIETPKSEEPAPKEEPPAPSMDKKKEDVKEKPKEKERKVRDGKDIKTRKLKKVARKLEKLGEDVDLHLKEEEDEIKEEKEEKK